MLLHDPEAKYAMEAVQDKKCTGTDNRFTFGDRKDSISGAVYIRNDEIVPKMLILMFNLKEGTFKPFSALTDEHKIEVARVIAES